MAWVKSEYAGEFAVLSTWLVALLPWGASFFQIQGFSVVAVRFLYARVQYVFGATVPGERPFLWTWRVPGFEGTPELALAARLGLVAATVYVLPLTGSVAYYLREDLVESLPVNPVRLLGGLVGVVGLLLAAAGAVLFRYKAGLVVPVAGPFALAFAYLMLTVDRT